MTAPLVTPENLTRADRAALEIAAFEPFRGAGGYARAGVGRIPLKRVRKLAGLGLVKSEVKNFRRRLVLTFQGKALHDVIEQRRSR